MIEIIKKYEEHKFDTDALKAGDAVYLIDHSCLRNRSGFYLVRSIKNKCLQLVDYDGVFTSFYPSAFTEYSYGSEYSLDRVCRK